MWHGREWTLMEDRSVSVSEGSLHSVGCAAVDFSVKDQCICSHAVKWSCWETGLGNSEGDRSVSQRPHPWLKSSVPCAVVSWLVQFISMTHEGTLSPAFLTDYKPEYGDGQSVMQFNCSSCFIDHLYRVHMMCLSMNVCLCAQLSHHIWILLSSATSICGIQVYSWPLDQHVWQNKLTECVLSSVFWASNRISEPENQWLFMETEWQTLLLPTYSHLSLIRWQTIPTLVTIETL